MRTSRNLKEETKRKISQSLKNKKKSETHRQNISKALTEYWSRIPMGENNEVTNLNKDE